MSTVEIEIYALSEKIKNLQKEILENQDSPDILNVIQEKVEKLTALLNTKKLQ